MSQPHLKPYPQYQDSGIDWLGKVPAHWEVMKSRRLFSQRNERAYASDKQLTASQKYGVIYQDDFMAYEGRQVVKVITGTDILKHVEPDDFVISMRSFQGGIEWCGNRGSISSAYVILIPSDRVNSRFFYYLLKCSPYIQALQSTTNLVRDGQALRYENFTLIDLPISPLTEQTAIAEFLDWETGKIDALVAEQRRLIDLLKEKRQAVISHAVTKGLNANALMKDSGIEWLGEIPAHWEVKQIKHLVSHVGSGKTPLGGSETYVDEGIIFLRSQNIYDEGLRLDEVAYISEEVHQAMRNSEVCSGDILLNITGASIGRSCLVPDNFPLANVNQHVCIIRLQDSKTVPLLSWIFKSATIKGQIDFSQNGAAREGLNYGQMTSMYIALPSSELEQKKITTFLNVETIKLDELITQSERAIELLQERRTALISAAVTGKIDVRQPAKVLAMA